MKSHVFRTKKRPESLAKPLKNTAATLGLINRPNPFLPASRLAGDNPFAHDLNSQFWCHHFFLLIKPTYSLLEPDGTPFFSPNVFTAHIAMPFSYMRAPAAHPPPPDGACARLYRADAPRAAAAHFSVVPGLVREERS